MLIIFVGNIATGKTHYRKTNFHNGERILCPDEWQDISLPEKNIKFISDLHTFLATGQTVVVDGNNINQRAREKYLELANCYHCTLKAIDFGPGSSQTLNRRLSQAEVDDHPAWIRSHFGYKNNYQKPTLEEGFHIIDEEINYEIV